MKQDSKRNFSKTSSDRIKRWVVNGQKRVTHKQQVLGRHQPGTAYHTRAMREIQAIEIQIREYQEELNKRIG